MDSHDFFQHSVYTLICLSDSIKFLLHFFEFILFIVCVYCLWSATMLLDSEEECVSFTMTLVFLYSIFWDQKLLHFFAFSLIFQ